MLPALLLMTHPTSHYPIRPSGPFPYDNCYHWFNTKLRLRVRARPEEFDETNAVKLTADGQVDLEFAWTDLVLAKQALERSSEDLQTSAVYVEEEEDDVEPENEEDGSDSPESSSINSESNASRSTTNLAGLARLDIFSGPNEDVDLLPLVDLWISELPEHLKQEDIPDPSELFAECERAVRIVKDARVRAYAAMTAQSPPVQACDDIASVNKRKRLRPAKMWAKIRMRARRISARANAILRLPLLPFWP
ncbi:hypothetical protein FKP32DRAFT_1755114 [Trametes sanguinea]|nr:hypothetical protein FKP32DRAFT_1755114 [Trametes sanguinea]